MTALSWSGRRGRLLPAYVLIASVCLLALAVVHGSRVAIVATFVLFTAVAVPAYRTLLRWDSLIAGLILVVFLIPIKRYTLPSQLPFNLEPYRILIAFVAAAWFTSLLIDKRVRFRASGLEPPILLFVFAAVASVVVNNSSIQAAGVSTYVVKNLTFFASFFVLLYVLVSLVRKREQLNRLIRLLVASGSLVALSAIVESRTNYNVFNHLGHVLPFLTYHDPSLNGATSLELGRGGRLRVYGSAEHPIELSAVLVMLIPLALYLARSTGRRAWFGAGVVLGLGALTSISRTGVVMMVVVGLVLVWLRPTDVKRLAPVLIPALCIACLAIPHTLGSFYSAFFPKGGLIADQSVAGQQCMCGRLAEFGPSLHEWSQRPLFGEGFGSRVVSTADSVRLGVAKARLLDDQWLSSLLEIGIAGVCALLWLFTRAIRRMARIAREDDGPDGMLAAAIAASVFAFAVGMLTFDSLGFVQVTITLFIFLAFSGVLTHLYREQTTGGTGTTSLSEA